MKYEQGDAFLINLFGGVLRLLPSPCRPPSLPPSLPPAVPPSLLPLPFSDTTISRSRGPRTELGKEGGRKGGREGGREGGRQGPAF
jgi:hypothetical protein